MSIACTCRLPSHVDCLQDVLVVTAPGSGAEIIPFLKTWVNLPAAVVFTIGYAQVRGFLIT
jgi:AAA family ATP:ADP antiporter